MLQPRRRHRRHRHRHRHPVHQRLRLKRHQRRLHHCIKLHIVCLFVCTAAGAAALPFEYSSVGVNDCPSGSSRVGEWTLCKAFVDLIKGNKAWSYDLDATCNPRLPAGCFFVGTAYSFNPGSCGSAVPTARLICAINTRPPPPDPRRAVSRTHATLQASLSRCLLHVYARCRVTAHAAYCNVLSSASFACSCALLQLHRHRRRHRRQSRRHRRRCRRHRHQRRRLKRYRSPRRIFRPTAAGGSVPSRNSGSRVAAAGSTLRTR